MLLLLLIIISFVIILTLKLLIPVLLRYIQLRKDYENISPLALSSIPGVGNLNHFDRQPYLFFQFIFRLAKQCQDEGKGLYCVWVGLWPMVVLCSPKGLENFMNNSKHLVKSFDYTFFEPWVRTGLVTSNHEKWRNRRRLITPSFHDTQLLYSFMDIFNEQATILAQSLQKFAKRSNETHDLYPSISACTLDIITEAATGTRLQVQLNEEKNEFFEATIQVSEIVSIRLRSPWLWPDFIFSRLPIGFEQKKALESIHGFSRKIIEERLATFTINEMASGDNDKKSRRRLVFLDNLLSQMKQENLTLDDIQEEVDTFMFAGHDTTATAINFFCYLMGCYPDVQAKVHAEMDSIFGDDRERECTMEDTQQMRYLDCVIKECMRILPPLPIIAREVQEDFIYCDHTIRKGTTVSVFIYAIHHDPNVYPDPEKFDPNRFIEDSMISNERSPFAFIPFSAGSRNCIGQRFAGLEERVVLSTLFRRFSFRSTQRIDELDLCIHVTLRPRVPIQMFVECR